MACSDSNLPSVELVDAAGDWTTAPTRGETGDLRSTTGAQGPVHRSLLRSSGVILLAALLGSCGVLVQVARDAPGVRVALLGLGLMAVVAAVLQQLDPGRRWSSAMVPPLLLVAFVAFVQPVVGRTPFMVVALSTTLASGALVRWRPLPGWPQRRTSTAPLALPPLLLLQFLWWRHASEVVAAVLCLVSLSALEFHARFPSAAGRVADRLARLTSAVASFVAMALVGLVALPLLYLPGAAVRVWMRLFGGRAGVVDSWQVADSAPDAAKSSFRLYARTPGALRRRRHRVSAGVALVGLAVAVLVGQRAVPSDGADDGPSLLGSQRQVPPPAATSVGEEDRDIFALEFATPYSELPAYRGVPWADQLQLDQAQQVNWDDDVQTQYFNSTGGIRRTLRSTCPCPEVTVWITGGSAVVGLGQRDDHTVASELVRIGEANGLSIDMVNLGQSGQTMGGEVARIESLLATTDPPDLIVFLNGWNDVAFRVAFSFVYGPDPATWTNLDAMSHLQTVNDRPEEFLASGIGPRAGTDAADLYARLQNDVVRLAEERGVETAFFFQPDALVEASQLEGYEELTNLSTSELMGSPFAVALDAAAARLGNRTRNLRQEFVGVEQPMFVGLVHQSEAGARLTAEAMFRDLEPTLRRLAG